MASARRGSGYSVTLHKGDKTGGMAAQDHHLSYGYGGAPVAPFYMQSPQYPMLINPPQFPTYSYGIPPSPLMYGPQGVPQQGSGRQLLQPQQQSQMSNLRRAGSINAKIMAADARRPFSNVNQHLSPRHDQDFVAGYSAGFGENPSGEANEDPTFDHGTMEEAEEKRSTLERLKKQSTAKQEGFLDKLKFWESSRPTPEEADEQLKSAEETLRRSYSVHKTAKAADLNDPVAGPVDPAPYPGLIIEEMLDSISVNDEIARSQREVSVAARYPETASVLGPEQFSASLPQRAPVRWKHSTPLNTVVMFVPQQEAWVVERMGKYERVLEPGLNVLVPLIDKIKYVQSLKEIAIDIPQQAAITIDNVTLNIDGVLYLRVVDPYKASYGVEDPEFAITQLAQTTMRSEIGKITLDTLFRERDNMNLAIVQAINTASDAWGIKCMRYEIRDIRMPARVQEAMQMQVEAERKKRAAILESEGIKAAEINVAEGKKQATILQSEAQKQELINQAQGAAEAVIAAGKARAQSIELVAEALDRSQGHDAASLAVAEKYVTAFQELARTNNTLILPSNTGDVTSMVAQAMTIYSNLQKPSAPAEPWKDDSEAAAKRNETIDAITQSAASSLIQDAAD